MSIGTTRGFSLHEVVQPRFAVFGGSMFDPFRVRSFYKVVGGWRIMFIDERFEVIIESDGDLYLEIFKAKNGLT